MKTLRSKIRTIHLVLIISILVIGIISAFTLFSLEKSLNSFMVDNYKSIKAVKLMKNSLEAQRNSLIKYIYSSDSNYINNGFNDEFSNENMEFNKAFDMEFNNITEMGEKAVVEEIRTNYSKFIKLFSKVQTLKVTKGKEESINLFNSEIQPAFDKLQKNLDRLSQINENSIFANKNNISLRSRNSTILIFIISLLSIVAGLIMSTYLAGKFLKPVDTLSEAIKSVKEGDFLKDVPVETANEIGIITREFNDMTLRLKSYEDSSTGKLMNEKNKFLAILEGINTPLSLIDENYKILMANKSFENTFSIEKKEYLNKNLLLILSKFDVDNYFKTEDLFDIGDCSKNSITLKIGTKKYYFNVSSALIKDDTSDSKNAIIMFQNLTEIKNVENIKSDFMSTISHEFKTPLTSIMIGTSLLRKKKIGELSEVQLKIINKIEEDSENLSELVTNILQMCRIEFDKNSLQVKPCSIIGVIENSIKEIYEKICKKEINIYYEASENLPKVMADAEKSIWIIKNLLMHMFKYLGSGDNIFITVQEHKEENKLYITIKSSELPLAEINNPYILNGLPDINHREIDFEYYNLGLIAAKKLVELQCGNFWCESSNSKCTCYVFTLPIST